MAYVSPSNFISISILFKLWSKIREILGIKQLETNYKRNIWKCCRCNCYRLQKFLLVEFLLKKNWNSFSKIKIYGKFSELSSRDFLYEPNVSGKRIFLSAILTGSNNFLIKTVCMDSASQILNICRMMMQPLRSWSCSLGH